MMEQVICNLAPVKVILANFYHFVDLMTFRNLLLQELCSFGDVSAPLLSTFVYLLPSCTPSALTSCKQFFFLGASVDPGKGTCVPGTYRYSVCFSPDSIGFLQVGEIQPPEYLHRLNNVYFDFIRTQCLVFI